MNVKLEVFDQAFLLALKAHVSKALFSTLDFVSRSFHDLVASFRVLHACDATQYDIFKRVEKLVVVDDILDFDCSEVSLAVLDIGSERV